MPRAPPALLGAPAPPVCIASDARQGHRQAARARAARKRAGPYVDCVICGMKGVRLVR